MSTQVAHPEHPDSLFYSDVSRHLERVRCALAEDLRREGNALESYDVDDVLPRLYSSVAFLTLHTREGDRRVVVKTTAHHPANKHMTEEQNQAVVEYEILKRLYAAMEHVEECFVPCPLLVLPQIETYVMEFVEGELFSEQFRHARYGSRRAGLQTLAHYYFLCGRWLKHFQEATGTRFADVDALERTLQGCDKQLRHIEERRDPACPVGLRDRVLRDLEIEQARLEGAEVPVSGRHGDFGPWNMLVGERGLTVIDFLGYHEDPVALDPLKILVHLDSERQCLTTSARRIAALRRSFLKGFGGLPALPEPLLVICEARQRLSVLANCLWARTTRLHQRLERRRLAEAHLRWLCGDRSRKLLWDTHETAT